MSVSTHVPEVLNDHWPDRGDVRPFRRSDFSVIREMLGTLETLTTAGQHHLIDKILDFVRGQVARAAPHTGLRNQDALGNLIQSLQRESERLAPDVASFTQGAESLLVLLSAIT